MAVSEFCAAAGEGKLATVQSLLQLHPHLVGCKDEDQRTAFHWACVGGHLDVAKCLLAAGAPIDNQDDEGWSALHSTASVGYLELVKLLLQENASQTLRTSAGCTPLHYAASKGHTEIVDCLLQNGEATLDIADNSGMTPLARAVSAEKLSTVSKLLESNSNWKEWTSAIDGDNILHIAVGTQNAEVSRCLAQACPLLIDKTNREGRSPADLASSTSVPQDVRRRLMKALLTEK